METDLLSGFDESGKNVQIELEGPLRDIMSSVILWTKVCAIAGFAGIIINLFYAVTLFNKFNTFGGLSSASMLGVNVISIIFSFLTNFSIFNFSKKLRSCLDNDSQEDFQAASASMKNYFMLIMVAIIVIVVFVIVQAVLISARSSSF